MRCRYTSRSWQETNARLIEASKAKSDFLANMSHELRTPLNSIIGFSEVLQDELFGDLNLKHKEYVQNIHISGMHLLSLINDILDLAKVESGKMELELTRFPLKEALDGLIRHVERKSPETWDSPKAGGGTGGAG